MTKIVSILLIIIVSTNVFAQQDPMYSQYMFDRLAINPAFAGSHPIVKGTLTYRKQFMGLEGAPETQKLTLHAPIQKKYMGVGLKIVHDKLGVTNFTSFSAVYAYHLGLAGGKLSFGLEGGVVNHAIDFTDLIRADQDDNAISLNKESQFVPDASFGLYYRKQGFYFGSTAFHLFEGKIDYTQWDRSTIAHLSRHYFITTGYNIETGGQMAVEPSFLLKQVAGAPMQLDINVSVIWKELFSLGASYRTGDGLAFIMKYLIKDNFIVGYSYDYTMSQLATYSSGSHEIVLSYQLNLLPPARDKVIDPRYYF